MRTRHWAEAGSLARAVACLRLFNLPNEYDLSHVLCKHQSWMFRCNTCVPALTEHLRRLRDTLCYFFQMESRESFCYFLFYLVVLLVKNTSAAWISVARMVTDEKIVHRQAPLTLWISGSFFVSQSPLSTLSISPRSFFIFRDCFDLSVFVRLHIFPYLFSFFILYLFMSKNVQTF